MESRRVKNKDLVTLSRVKAMEAEIQALEEREAWQRERMQKITATLTGVPGGGGGKRGMDDALSALEELENDHKRLIKSYTRLVRKAEGALCRVQSQEIRAIVRLCYMDGATDRSAWEALGITRYRLESAKRAIESAESLEAVRWADRLEKDD